MNTATRLAVYAGALACAFGLAWGVGTAVGPGRDTTAGHDTAAGHDAAASQDTAAGHDHGAAGNGHGSGVGGAAAPGGLAMSDSGYTLAVQRRTFAAGVPGELAFTISGSDGRPVTAFDVEHDQQLHLIVVRRDTTGFQHLHPELGADGVWRTPLTLPAGGVYRAFADFVPTGGPALTLGADLFVPGRFAPAMPAPSRIARVGDYEVRLDGGLVGGARVQVVATVTRRGVPVTDLQPYLGAFGHLVALRQDDLAFLRVHPHGTDAPRPTARAGPQVAFTADVPSAATYRLFLDFRHDGAVHTAEFTLATDDSPTPG